MGTPLYKGSQCPVRDKVKKKLFLFFSGSSFNMIVIDFDEKRLEKKVHLH